MDYGDAVRELRKSRKLTQEDLAKECKCSVTTVNNIEKNKCNPTEKTKAKISEALKYPKSYFALFAVTEDEIPESMRTTFRCLKNFLMGEFELHGSSDIG